MSSNAGSPSAASVTSPPNLTSLPAAPLARPSLCMKPLPNALSPITSATLPSATLTSKEWIVPPRPKPGRKPATDTPPTKRKAQNRAAQRAFRERRAARVGELEEQLKQIEDENDQQQDELKVNISKLEQEVERYQNDLATWIERCRRLEKELATVKASSGQLATSSASQPAASSSEIVGCGNCTLDTRCQCIDDAFNAMTGFETADNETSQSEHQDVASTGGPQSKRIKTEPSDSMEIDFTAMYSKPANSNTRHPAVTPSSAVADPCGFCQDGTPCICAEMAAEQQRASTSRTVPSEANQGHPPRQMAQFTPPPSEGDVTQPIATRASGCASAPGTCVQCRADPNSTLFCKSLAASRSQSATEPSGCCGGKGADGGCCRSEQPSRSTRSKASAGARILPPLQGSKSSITLTCADAYTTLSRHPAYERASGEIATWMPKLYAKPSGSEGRPAMEIDAANVMAVLRDFDRRFGTDR